MIYSKTSDKENPTNHFQINMTIKTTMTNEEVPIIVARTVETLLSIMSLSDMSTRKQY